MFMFKLTGSFLSVVIYKKIWVFNVTSIRSRYFSFLMWWEYHSPLMRLNPFPVYYVEDARDCDHVRSCSSAIAKNGWDYVTKRNSAYENAEGPTSFYRITKQEHAQYKSYTRDYIAEAHENGHPYRVGY